LKTKPVTQIVDQFIYFSIIPILSINNNIIFLKLFQISHFVIKSTPFNALSLVTLRGYISYFHRSHISRLLWRRFMNGENFHSKKSVSNRRKILCLILILIFFIILFLLESFISTISNWLVLISLQNNSKRYIRQTYDMVDFFNFLLL